MHYTAAVTPAPLEGLRARKRWPARPRFWLDTWRAPQCPPCLVPHADDGAFLTDMSALCLPGPHDVNRRALLRVNTEDKDAAEDFQEAPRQLA